MNHTQLLFRILKQLEETTMWSTETLASLGQYLKYNLPALKISEIRKHILIENPKLDLLTYKSILLEIKSTSEINPNGKQHILRFSSRAGDNVWGWDKIYHKQLENMYFEYTQQGITALFGELND